ncbi:MAG: sigma-70 family RNA polymerase sigma factor [Sphingomonas sp.]|nr:sigma-70 family RNA polymerase sigma factor [Sphingomonas sp.]
MLAERWNRKLIAHAWRLTGDRELAMDSAQGAWLEILRSLPRLQDDRAFPAWAYRIVSRRCSRQIGAIVQNRRLSEAAANEAPAQEESAPSTLDEQRLRSAIAALPADQRSAVALFYLEEMSVAQVAVALEIPAGTVKTRLLHARRKLRLALEGEK